jgi:hypothetical protein
MLHDTGSPAEMTADELYAAYRAAIREAVTTVGTETAAAETGIAPERVAALADGDDPGGDELTLEEATGLLALTAEETGEEMAALAREDLLIGMSSAVLDVEALAARLEGDLEPREIQSKVEGRFPMTLREFALIRAYLGSRTGE